MTLHSDEEIQDALRSLVARWNDYAGTERAEAQTFLNELYAAYGADRKFARWSFRLLPVESLRDRIMTLRWYVTASRFTASPPPRLS